MSGEGQVRAQMMEELALVNNRPGAGLGVRDRATGTWLGVGVGYRAGARVGVGYRTWARGRI